MRVLLAIAFCLFASVASAADLCVGDGSAGNDSTAKASISYVAGNEAGSTCWDSIVRATWGNLNRYTDVDGTAAEAASAGDTIYVFNGTYNFAGTCTGSSFTCRFEPTYSPIAEGVSVDNRITIVCVGTCALTGDAANAPAFGVIDKNHIKFYADRSQGHRWTISACGEDPNNGGTDDCTDDATWAAIPDTGPVVCIGSVGVWIEGVVVSSAAPTVFTDNWEGIRLDQSCDSATVRNNTVTNFQNATGTLNGTCFTVYHAPNFLVEHNECSGSASGFIIKNQGTGRASGTFRFNKFTDLTVNCFTWSIQGGDPGDEEGDILVYQNTCDSPGQHGVRSQGVPGPLDCRIINNTFYNIPIGISLGAYNGCWFYNNIIHTAGEMVASAGASVASAADMDHEHNVYFTATTRFYSGPDGNQTTLENFNLAYAGMNTVSPVSIDTDPRLANPATGDFRLCTASMTPDVSCAGESSVRATPLGVDVLDLDGDSSTSDNVPPGAYISAGQTEDIGLTADAAPDPEVPLNDKRLRVLRFRRAINWPPLFPPQLLGVLQ